MTPADAIRQRIEAANAAWFDGRPREVASLFAADAVFVAPDLETVVSGRDAIVQSYVDYVEHVPTHAFDVHATNIQVVGETAVATYTFTVRYTLEGTPHIEDGVETMVFANRDGDWRCIWRTQRTAP